MNTALVLDALKKQFENQNHELDRLQQVLAELDPPAGARLPIEALQAINEALEVTPGAPARASLPSTGTRA
jgi:hypothetical protein